MKHTLVTSLLAGLICFLPGNIASARDLTLRADAWCPYNCAPGKAPGYLIEIATLALAPAGHKIDYQLLDWQAALDGAAKGQFTAAVGANAIEAPKLIFPTESLGHTKTIAVTIKGRGKAITSLASLHGLRIGFAADYFYETSINAYLDAHRAESRMVGVTGDDLTQDLMLMLMDGKVDVVIEDANVADYVMESSGYHGLLEFAPLGPATPVSIGFSAADPQARTYATLIDNTVRRLRASGELKRILGHYGLRDWQ